MRKKVRQEKELKAKFWKSLGINNQQGKFYQELDNKKTGRNISLKIKF